MNENDRVNPYSTQDTANEGGEQSGPPTGFTSEMCGNLTLTSKLVRITSLFAAVGALVSTNHALMEIQTIPRAHLWLATRIFITVSMWIFVAMAWKYATALNAMAKHGVPELPHLIERNAKLWLSTTLMLLIFLVTLASIFAEAARNGYF